MILVIPIFVPHAGCPHDCCFCNQKIISGSKKLPGSDEIAGTIEGYRNDAKRYDEVELAFFGGSFTAIDPLDQEHYLKAASPFLKSQGGFIDCIRISTRPDAVDPETVKRLKKYSVRIVELGAQSMDDEVLRLSERGHTAEDTVNASKLLKDSGFVLGLQTMTGLPGAGKESDIKTARMIAELKPDFVRIYPTVVVSGTGLCRDFESGVYKPMEIKEAVELCSELCEIYAENGIKVARIGLQSTDSITRNGSAGEVRGGPYHEAFGQLVRSYDAASATCSVLDGLLREDRNNVRTLTLVTSPEYFSDALGQKKSNAKYYKETYGFKTVSVRSVSPDDSAAKDRRAGKVIKRQSFVLPDDENRFKNRLARVTGAEICVRREPTGKDSFRDVTDVTLRLEFKSLR